MSYILELPGNVMLPILQSMEKCFAYRGIASDANDCTNFGVYMLPSNASNIPEGTYRNVLICLPFWENGEAVTAITQILIAHRGARLLIRQKESINGDWSEWNQIGMSSLV